MKVIITFTFSFMFLLLALSSCGKRNPNAPPIFPDPFIWDRDPRTCGLTLLSEQKEFAREIRINTNVYAHIIIGFGEFNPEYRYNDNMVEVDFGDGSGWIDVSESVLSYLQTGEFIFLPSHKYDSDGAFQAKARVTFWDGEVYESSPFAITVLPANDGRGGA